MLFELPTRRADAHKGDFGRVLVVGGSRGMIGAPALAANAALRSGAGLVTVAVPEPVQLTVASLCPCATSIPLKCDKKGDFAPQAVGQMLAAADAADVLAVGPGMGVSGGADQLVRAALGQDRPVVLDADGLNNLARIDGWAGLRRCPLVLTPHPGEFARLTGKSVEQIQSDREASALAAAKHWFGVTGVSPVNEEDMAETAMLHVTGVPPVDKEDMAGTAMLRTTGVSPVNEEDMAETAMLRTTGVPPVDKEDMAGTAMLRTTGVPPVIVLKGAGTVVTDGKRIYINDTGNPGMATGGSGDVLTGLIAALIGRGLDTFEAACLGVHIHGLAGDLAAEKLGQISLIASDLVDFLPGAIQKTTSI